MHDTIERQPLLASTPGMLPADPLAGLPELVRARLARHELAHHRQGEVVLVVSPEDLRSLYAALRERFDTHFIDLFAERSPARLYPNHAA